jgi:hypothetical protein
MLDYLRCAFDAYRPGKERLRVVLDCATCYGLDEKTAEKLLAGDLKTHRTDGGRSLYIERPD